MLKFAASHDHVGASLCQAQSLGTTDATSTTNHYSNLACQFK
jgi:hypothetical protein